MSTKILLRALPNVEFVHGFPGIPAGPDRPQATIRGAIEVRLGNQAVKAKWVKVELRKIETIPSGNRGEEFVDLVGQSPITIWQAQNEQDTLSSKDFPFSIRVPETIPPSVALERGAGIKYEVVATLCTKGKKGLLRREASIPISHSVPVVIDKHELHSTWPIYAQPESRHVVSDGLTLAVDRSNTCFAPADRLSVVATLKSDNLSPVVFRGFELSLRETIIYRVGPQSHGKKNGPQVQTTTLGEQKAPVLMTLYGGTQHRAELGCVIPGNHTTSSVNAGRHIDIGYSLNIKAFIDMANPIIMDLPVTITNWPRHVSAEMIRRIGTAPNLSLQHGPPPGSGISTLPHAAVSRPGQTYGPPRPPPSGGLPSLPNGGGPPRTIPPGALVSTPPGSPNLSQAASAMNPYSFQQSLYSVPAQASQPLSTITTPDATMVTASGGQTTTTPGGPDEFGYNRHTSTNSATAPLRQNEKHDFGLIEPNHRSATTTHRPATSQSDGSDFDTGVVNRFSQYSQDTDALGDSVTSPTASTRARTRAMSRTALRIINTNDDIPEEESPIGKNHSSEPFDNVPKLADTRPTPAPGASTPSAPSWPTSDQEKQRLYEKAKAKAERAQARARAASENLSQDAVQASNGHESPPRQASPDQINGDEGSKPVDTTTPRTPWPTAEEEKQRLFERARSQVRQTQALATASSAPINTSPRPSHNRTVSSNSSQESRADPALSAYTTASPPTMSAGAALYSHAMASIVRPASTLTPFTPPVTSVPRRNVSHAGSSTSGSSTRALTDNKRPTTAEDDKSAIRYLQAKNAVDQRQRNAGLAEDAPQDGPISYEELFGGRPNTMISGPGVGSQLSEKQLQAQAYEARDAAGLTTNQPTTPSATTQRSHSVRSTPSSHTPLSEKEVLRRAFEARDIAILRSGQTPPPIISPSQPPPPVTPSSQPPPSSHAPPWTGGSSSSNTSTPKPPLSEKERMKLAFEARDRALAAQQPPPPPPDYGASPASPARGRSPLSQNDPTHRPLTAAEEKAQLKARYALEEARPGMRPAGDHTPIPQSSPPPEPWSRSDTGETFLRRDPTISAGKKRASQMLTPPPPSPPPPPPPPPLPPHPPAEYIEETKLEDRRNTLVASVASVTLPPSDFSSTFDLNFESFPGGDGEATSKHP